MALVPVSVSSSWSHIKSTLCTLEGCAIDSFSAMSCAATKPRLGLASKRNFSQITLCVYCVLFVARWLSWTHLLQRQTCHACIWALIWLELLVSKTESIAKGGGISPRLELHSTRNLETSLLRMSNIFQHKIAKWTNIRKKECSSMLCSLSYPGATLSSRGYKVYISHHVFNMFFAAMCTALIVPAC